MTFSHNVAAELSFLASQIPPEAAEYVAKIFSEIAKELELKSFQFSEQKAATVVRIQQSRHIDLLICMEIERGATLDQTISTLSAYDVHPDQVRYLWHNLKRRIAHKQQIEMRKTILRLRSRNWTNCRIAKHLGVSIRTIQRALKT